MILAILRTLYFIGPLLALAIIVMPFQRKSAWVLWGMALCIVAAHWLSYFTAAQYNATQVSIFGIATWTPLIITTFLAGLTQERWRNWHNDLFISQSVVCLICLLPSLLVFVVAK